MSRVTDHYERARNSLAGGVLSYKGVESAETYIERARAKEQG